MTDGGEFPITISASCGSDSFIIALQHCAACGYDTSPLLHVHCLVQVDEAVFEANEERCAPCRLADEMAEFI